MDNPLLINDPRFAPDEDIARYSILADHTSQPLGISSYELSKLVPEEFKGSMPTIEEIEAELKE
jgi:hypothetical protein